MVDPPADTLTEPVSTYALSGETMSKTYEYIYASGTLMRQVLTVTIGNSTTTYAMDFFYDASGYPFAVKYNGDLCYYITNLQGDVMSIVDAQGEVVAEYEYDPYGNIISQSGPLAEANPLRYRGYVYDTESGLYYLQSRYYDPELGRFINADSYISTGQGVLGNNMFAYCLNNPVTCIDSDGNRTYFINGISNDNSDGPPDYAEDFEEELEECSDEEVKLIPVYEGQTNGLLTAAGAALVLLEMMNQYSYTYKVVLAILADLAENPLAEGETLNIIGYSGGGQLALNAMELLAKQGIHVDNVILIGAPVVEILNTSTKVSMFISSKDILSINWKPGFDAYYVGHLGHTDYFSEVHITDIATLVSNILGKGAR